MENKNFHELERERVLGLREDFNRKEELKRIGDEIARIHSEQVERSQSRQPIDTVADAIGFLEEHCNYLAVRLDVVPVEWKLVSLDGEFEVLFTEDKLIDFARDERDVRFVLSGKSWMSWLTAPGDEEASDDI